MNTTTARFRLLLAAAASCLLVAAGLVVVSARPSQAQAFATLDVLKHPVEVRSEAGEEFLAGRDGDHLQKGSAVRTGANGIAAVAYFDGSLTRVGPDSDYEIEQLERGSGSRRVVGRLEVGQTFHRVQKVSGTDSRFEVKTSNAVAAVRGTEFAVRCESRRSCDVAVVEGAVAVQPAQGSEVLVEGGHQVEVREDGALGEIEPISADDPWLATNRELDSAGAGPVAETAPAPAAETDTVDGESDVDGESEGGDGSEVAASEPAREDGPRPATPSPAPTSSGSAPVSDPAPAPEPAAGPASSPPTSTAPASSGEPAPPAEPENGQAEGDAPDNGSERRAAHREGEAEGNASSTGSEGADEGDPTTTTSTTASTTTTSSTSSTTAPPSTTSSTTVPRSTSSTSSSTTTTTAGASTSSVSTTTTTTTTPSTTTTTASTTTTTAKVCNNDGNNGGGNGNGNGNGNAGGVGNDNSCNPGAGEAPSGPAASADKGSTDLGSGGFLGWLSGFLFLVGLAIRRPEIMTWVG